MGSSTEPVGTVHVHTGHSDGAGGAGEIAAAAAKIGLDFVVVTDHDSLAVREAGGEGWHGNVLIAVGCEISTKRNATHLVGLNLESVVPRCRHTVHESLEFVRGQGGTALLAHAHGRGLGGKRRRSRHSWPWWSHPHLGGVEVWNYLQDWGASFRLLDPASYRLDHVARRIKGPPEWVLGLWDAEAEQRPFAGIAGNDNHAKRLPFLGRTYWPHEAVLGRLVNRVRLEEPLSKDGARAARQLMAALAAGRCVFAREELAGSRGFDLRAEYCPTRPTALRPGDSAPFAPGTTLIVESPVEAELRVCRLGKAVASAFGTKLEFEPTEPGAYRAEARLHGSAQRDTRHPTRDTRSPTPDTGHPVLPWCFSNHIRLEAPGRRPE